MFTISILRRIPIKIVCIGNQYMGDDGIGILVGENIKNKLKYDNIKFIIGEIDTEYCIEEVYKNDFLIIIDSICTGKSPGSLSLLNIHDIMSSRQFYSQHEQALMTLVNSYSKYNSGFLIGIEISSINLCNSISKELYNSFDEICYKILKIVNSSYIHSSLYYDYFFENALYE
ncbi:hydrogenase maturation protease [Clostridium tepidiprofundi]|nr:hydrogenase maturation protease [Clostridium tepidiprofundi]